MLAVGLKILVSPCLFVDATEPVRWLEAGGLLPCAGWCFAILGDHTCFIRFVGELWGSWVPLGCWFAVIFVFILVSS